MEMYWKVLNIIFLKKETSCKKKALSFVFYGFFGLDLVSDMDIMQRGWWIYFYSGAVHI